MVQKARFGPIEAFEEYYNMGEKRSLMKVELLLRNAPERKGPSLRTLKGWSAKLEWREQIAERNSGLRRALTENAIKEIAEYKTDFLNKIERVIETAFEKDGKPIIVCEKARDLRDLVDIALKLMPEEGAREMEIRFNIRKYGDKKKDE